MSKLVSKTKEELGVLLKELSEEIDCQQKTFKEMSSLFMELVGKELPKEGLTYKVIRRYLDPLEEDEFIGDYEFAFDKWIISRDGLERAVREWNSIKEKLFHLTPRPSPGRRVKITAFVTRTGSIDHLVETVTF